MNKRIWQSSLVVGAVGVALNVLAAPGAFASHGGPGHGGGGKIEASTSGTGPLGSPWTLKSALDDLNGVPTVGEEFEINTSANTPPDAVGQVWHVQFSQNGVVFLDDNQATPTTGIREAKMTPRATEPLTMSVHAVNLSTNETIDGSVQLP